MKKDSKTGMKPNMAPLMELHVSHRRFHAYLDKISASTNDQNIIDLLIQIRGFNLECIQKYTGLISNGEYTMTASKTALPRFMGEIKEDNMTLWNLHGQLSRLMLQYSDILRDKSLNKVSRMIVSNNYDKLISTKDNLLHPIPALELA